MITPVRQLGTSLRWAQPARASGPQESPDRVELSHETPTSKAWYRRAWEWACGATQQAAVEPAGLPAQVAVIAQQPPEDFSLDGPHARLGERLINAVGEASLKRAMRAELQQCQEVSPEQAALRALESIPADRASVRAEVGKVALTQLKLDLALTMLGKCCQPSNQAALAIAALGGQNDPQALLGQVIGTDKGRAAPAALDATSFTEHGKLARGLLKETSDELIRGAVAQAILQAAQQGAGLEAAAEAGLKAVPSNYSTTRGQVSLAVVRALPGLALARPAVEACSDETCRASITVTALKGVQEKRPAGALALEMLGSLPGNYSSNRAAVSQALARGLKGDPQVGAAADLARAMMAGASDESVKTGVFAGVLGSRLREESPGKTALAGIAAIPGNYTTNRAGVTRAALKALREDPEVGGYCQIGMRLIQGLSDESLNTHIGVSVLESGLARRSLVDTARAAMETIPSNYTTNRAGVAMAILNELEDSPEVSLARNMVKAAEDMTCKTGIVLAALEAIGSGEEAPLPKTGKALLQSIPSNYTTNRTNAARALLSELRAYYSDPEADSLIDGASGSPASALEVLDKLVSMKTAKQQVEELAAAVTGQAGVGGVEERGQVVVIGGVRVKVKK